MNDKIVLPVWTFGLFVVVMNTTMFNVSIPGIIADLRISADLGAWIISSYSIGYALSTIIYSRLSDTVPIRTLVAAGLSVLGAASVYGLFARDFEAVLAARILQSAGSGVMAGLGLVIAARYIPAERRGRAITLISAGSAMAFGLGPVVGGLITEYAGWNGLFGVTCLVLAVLPVLLRLLPREEPVSAGFDIRGAALTVLNATTLLLAVTRQSWLWLAISLASFALHAAHAKRAERERAFISPELFRIPGYGKLTGAGFAVIVLNMSNLFLMPLVLAHAFHRTPMEIGFLIAPGAILSALMTRFTGRWIDRYGNLPFLLLGHVVMGLVLAFYSLGLSLSPAVILIGYLFYSPAISATTAALNNETTRILPKSRIGAGMGLMQLNQFFGGSLSVASFGVLLERLRDWAPVEAYRAAYEILLAVCVGSCALIVWYRLAGGERRSAQESRESNSL